VFGPVEAVVNGQVLGVEPLPRSTAARPRPIAWLHSWLHRGFGHGISLSKPTWPYISSVLRDRSLTSCPWSSSLPIPGLFFPLMLPYSLRDDLWWEAR
jgi:hypothetical protein